MSKSNHLLALFILINLNFYCQEKTKIILDEIPNQSYHPLLKSKINKYKRDFSTYKISFDSKKVKVNKKKYYTQIADYGETKLYSYYRENMGSIVYFTTDVKKETVEIPKMQFVGMTWYQSDSTWKYTIISVNDTLKTPKYSFLKCLVIESEDLKCKNSNNCYKKYLQFYQRGRGYVGTEISGLLYTYMVIEE